MKAGALVAASLLFFLGAASKAQTPIQCGVLAICTPKDVYEWASSNFAIERLNIRPKLDELRGGAELLRKDLELLKKDLERERNQSVFDAKVTSDGLDGIRNRLAKTSDDLTQLQGRAQQLEQLIQTQERLRQDLAEVERRVSGIAAGVQMQLGRTRDELRGDITRLQEVVSELQKDRTERERALEKRLLSLQITLQGDNKNLENRLTALESRKTGLDELRRELTAALQESRKADLENAEGESRKVRTDMETLRETQAAGEKAKLDFERQLRETREAQDKAKLDFERQLREMREEFRSGVGAIRKEVDAQVTDTKKEVTEIRRSTAPVTVDVDGRPVDALPADRDSYLAAISRVMNAPKARTPREEYEAAGADLQKFMDSVANPGFRGSSFFWLGMAQAGAGQCKDALVSFEEMRKLVDTARHPRYPTAMLQKATCQLFLKEPQDRINRSVKELIDQFPGSPEADTARTLLPAPRRNR